MEVLPVNVFKDSFGPILKLLNENEIKYQIREHRAGEVMASSGVIEIIINASLWGSLVVVIVAYIRVKNGREVTITTKDNQIIHAKGLNSKELESVLKHAKNITAIDTGKD